MIYWIKTCYIKTWIQRLDIIEWNMWLPDDKCVVNECIHNGIIKLPSMNLTRIWVMKRIVECVLDYLQYCEREAENENSKMELWYEKKLLLWNRVIVPSLKCTGMIE